MLNIGKQLSAEERLSKAVVAIMGHPRYTALAGILMIGDKTICDDTPTACTNGRDVKFGRDFVDALTDAELRGLILHEEEGHKLYRHLTTWRHLYDIDSELANIACDYVINIKIADDNKYDGFAKLPSGALLDAKYRGMDSAAVFNLLKQDKDDEDDGSEPSAPSEGGTGIPMDDHDWEGAKELSQEEQDELARDIDEAVRQGRLMSQGIIMPSGVSDQVEELVIAIDTSGSIDQWSLTAFLTEVKCICDTVKPNKLRLLYWGHTVVGDESYEMHELDDLIKSTKPLGGGGTDVNCVTEYMTKHSIKPQACVVLTDGHLYSGWGEWTCPVLWTVLNNKGAVPSNGTCVHIKSGDML